MRYLSLSTLVEVEACEYPDPGKVLSVAGKRHSGACSLLRMRSVITTARAVEPRPIVLCRLDHRWTRGAPDF
jgi:hypothetical protein